jgi:hypothetical protein
MIVPPPTSCAADFIALLDQDRSPDQVLASRALDQKQGWK